MARKKVTKQAEKAVDKVLSKKAQRKNKTNKTMPPETEAEPKIPDETITSSDNPNLIQSLETLDDFLASRDTSKNAVYISKIPEVCKNYPCILGIDEAGRGPVLGPMVYGIAFCPLNRADLLVKLGCADSKELTEEEREDIFINTCKNHLAIGWAIDVIAPNFISNSMLEKSKVSLNQVSMDSAIALIRKALSEDVKVEYIYVDTVGPPEKYEAYLKTLFPQIHIKVAKKADSKYPIVSAASICAKVSRDHALKVWKFKEKSVKLGEDGFGSGYPADPKTQNFLVENYDPVFGYPELVRFSWQTASTALEKCAYLLEMDEEETEQPPKNNTTITSFFQRTLKGKRKGQHVFFKNRCLSSTKMLS